MIQQMMMLMRIEMQLQQQALFNLQQSQDADVERTPGLDSTLALDNQLSEISSILSTLIRSTSVGQRSGRRRPSHRDLHGAQRLRRTDAASAFARSAALRRLSSISARQWREIDGTVNDDSSSTDENAEDSGDDDDDVLDMNSPAPLNDVDVDDFIWQQLNATADETTADHIRASPDTMSTASSVPDIRDLSAVQSLASFQSLPSISSVTSIQSLSYISTASSYAPSESPSLSCEGRQVMSRCVVCMGSCEPPITQEQCLCQACGVFGSGTVFDGGDDGPLLGSHHEVHPEQPVLSSEGASAARSWQMDVAHMMTGAQSAHDRHSSECMSTCPTHSMPPATNTVLHTLPPLTGTGLMMSLPAVDPVYPQSLLPGTHRPPHFNYAGRLRRQASDMTHLPSEVSIRPWPLPAADYSAVANHLPSPTMNSFTSRRGAPSNRASVRQLPTYNLSADQRSTAAASALPTGSAHRGRGTRLSRYNTSLSRRPRP